MTTLLEVLFPEDAARIYREDAPARPRGLSALEEPPMNQALIYLAIRMLSKTSPFTKAECAAAHAAYLRATGRQP